MSQIERTVLRVHENLKGPSESFVKGPEYGMLSLSFRSRKEGSSLGFHRFMIEGIP